MSTFVDNDTPQPLPFSRECVILPHFSRCNGGFRLENSGCPSEKKTACLHKLAHFCTVPCKYRASAVQNQRHMATVKYYLDTRATKPGCPSPIRLAIRVCNSAAYLTTGVCVLPSEWNATLGKVVANRRRQFFNDYLEQFRMQVVNLMFDLKLKGELYALSARQIRDRYLSSVAKTVAPRFYDWALEQAETKGAVRRSSIQSTLRHLELFEPRVREWSFDDFTPRFLRDLQSHMLQQGLKHNSVVHYLTDLRCLFRTARIDELMTKDPFRGLQLRLEATRKRSLSLDDLRLLFALRPSKALQTVALDVFRLSFLLIGINPVDLVALGAPVNGRVEYRRAKTGRLYSVKLEPEALALIEKYRGAGARLLDFGAPLPYKNFLERVTRGLHSLDVPFAAELTIYWGRHTWATLAAGLDVPKDTIAAALGHGANTVTDVYIDFDRRKVDAANRRVIDLVLHGE